MRAFPITLLAAVVFLPMLSGCDRGVSKEELRSPVFEVPKVSGAEDPYPLPKLGPPPPDSDPFGMP